MQLNSESVTFLVGNADTVRNMETLPAEEPFSEGRIAFLDRLSKTLLSDGRSRAYPDIVTFAFWIRKSSMERYGRTYVPESGRRLGRGILFHIAPSNVAVNYAYSFAAGFITGNANIVRLPSREFEQTAIINEAVVRVMEQDPASFGRYGKYIAFVRYGKEKAVNDAFSGLCSVRIVWGGDATIKELRKSPLGVRAGEITFADRYSLCVIDAEQYLDWPEKRKTALGFYNDTYLTDQNACTSPRMVCWLGTEKHTEAAKKVFWKELHRVVTETYDFQPVQSVDKLTQLCLAAAAMDGLRLEPMPDCRVTRIRLKTPVLEIQEFRGHSGFFYEYGTMDILDLRNICNSRVQTVSYFGKKDMLNPLLQEGVRGIDRICEIGRTMDFDLTWDGYNLVERMTRTIGGIA